METNHSILGWNDVEGYVHVVLKNSINIIKEPYARTLDKNYKILNKTNIKKVLYDFQNVDMSMEDINSIFFQRIRKEHQKKHLHTAIIVPYGQEEETCKLKMGNHFNEIKFFKNCTEAIKWLKFIQTEDEKILV
ncbi:hypothetical protein HNQ88_002936 [Aureibacter tunicatorum]|uniref:SpoIIAA-like protein n=2 Tax=Aureibacter tunicatorum TaxID=866807 RepID=A0AAE3XPT6_9BACT|nr:hypothetical protein [Aureibacter tunicatorum]BDD04363.1 hypothetical protein AUTU_18460 [Aureibacter tunicatorum]